MKKYSIILFVLVSFTSLTSCELEGRNDDLSAGFSGKLVDKNTGEIVRTDHTGNRAKLCFIDESYGGDAHKIEYNILPEGRYMNTKIFPATYTVYAKGPFIEVDTIKGFKLHGKENFDLKVKPYLTIKILEQEVRKGKMHVNYSYKLNTNSAKVKISGINLYYSKFPYPGHDDVDSKTTFIISNNPDDREGTITSEFYLDENFIYYVRAGGTVNVNDDYYNYSEAFETPSEFEPATEEKMSEKNWTVHEFSSEEPAEGGGNGLVTAAFDNDINTFWHSAWSETSPDYPHHFSVNVGELKEITAFECIKRQGKNKTDGPNKIQLLVSKDGDNWTDLGKFDFDNTNDAVQRFEVEKTEFKYFKFVALEGPYNYAYLAEIDIYVSR